MPGEPRGLALAEELSLRMFAGTLAKGLILALIERFWLALTFVSRVLYAETPAASDWWTTGTAVLPAKLYGATSRELWCIAHFSPPCVPRPEIHIQRAFPDLPFLSKRAKAP